MHNLFLVTIFSISVTLLALNYSSNVILYNRAFNRVYANFERSISNKDYLNRIIDLIKNNNDDDIKQLFNLIKTVENENLTIEIKDISSKMDLNFIDFTIFKDEPFITLLKEEYNWSDLESYRNNIGIIGNIELYRTFFKDGIDYDSLFTVYSWPNINNASDIMIENLYKKVTNNEAEANNLKLIIDEKRKGRILIDNDSYNIILNYFNKDIKNILTTIPIWNINNIDKKLLKFILNKYNIDSSRILNLRDQKEISEDDLNSLFNIDEDNKAILTYLGVNTTFYTIDIKDNKNRLITTIIIGFDISSKYYKIISLKKYLL